MCDLAIDRIETVYLLVKKNPHFNFEFLFNSIFFLFFPQQKLYFFDEDRKYEDQWGGDSFVFKYILYKNIKSHYGQFVIGAAAATEMKGLLLYFMKKNHNNCNPLWSLHY